MISSKNLTLLAKVETLKVQSWFKLQNDFLFVERKGFGQKEKNCSDEKSKVAKKYN